MSRSAQASRIEEGIAGSIDSRSAEIARIVRRQRIAAKGRAACDEALKDASAEDTLSILKAIVREACARIKAQIGWTAFTGFWGSLGSTYVAPKPSRAAAARAARAAFKTGGAE